MTKPTRESVNTHGQTKRVVLANSFPASAHIDTDILEALESIMVKRNGVFTLLRNCPAGYGPRALIWLALHNAKHAANWGNLASWNEGCTGRLIMANEKDRELFNRAFDQLADAFRAFKTETNAQYKERVKRINGNVA